MEPQTISGIIAHTHLVSQGEIIRTIYQGGANAAIQKALKDTSFSSLGCFLKNLRLKTTIKSLQEVKPPSLELEDDDSVRLQKSLDVEWKSKRFELNLWISKQFQSWVNVGVVALINLAAYPYRTFNLLDLLTDSLGLEFGINDRIGYSINNVGYGLPSGQDQIVIFGSWVEEYSFSRPIIITGTSGEQKMTDLTAVNQKLDEIILNQENAFSWIDTVLRENLTNIQNNQTQTSVVQPQQGFIDGFLAKAFAFLKTENWRTTWWLRAYVLGTNVFPMFDSGFSSFASVPTKLVFGDFVFKKRLYFYLGGGLTTRPDLKLWDLEDLQGNSISGLAQTAQRQLNLLSGTNDTQNYLVSIDTSSVEGQTGRLAIIDNDTTISWGQIQIVPEFALFD